MLEKAAARRAHSREQCTRRDVGAQSTCRTFLGARPGVILDEENRAACRRFTRESFLLCCLENQSCADVACAPTDHKPGHRLESSRAGQTTPPKKRLTKTWRRAGRPLLFGSRHLLPDQHWPPLPSGLIGLTSRAAVETFASPGLASVSISPRVISLVQGMLKGMVLSSVQGNESGRFWSSDLPSALPGRRRSAMDPRIPHRSAECTGKSDHFGDGRTVTRANLAQTCLDLLTSSEIPCRPEPSLGWVPFRFRQGNVPGCHRPFLPMGSRSRHRASGAVVHIWGNGQPGRRSRGLRARPDSPGNFESIK